MSEWESLPREGLLALVAAQAERIRELEALVAAQAQTIAQLLQRIAELERKLSRNSGNSSMPPSTDDHPGRTKPARPDKPADGGVKRKRGKQPGAAGANLEWVHDATVVDHHPVGACACGADLAQADDEGVDRACQVTDVPLVTATTTEHRMHQARCGCGRTHVAPAPAEAGAANNTRVYGPNLRALVVYLLVFQHVPVQRCAQLVADLTGASPSEGFVHGMLARCAEDLGEVTQMIKTLITLSHVVHFDETTLRVGKAGVKRYVWSASTNRYTLFALGRRSGKQFRSWNVTAGFHGVAVHDRYAVYFTKDNFTDDVAHQICCSHLLRDLTDAAESYPTAEWPHQCSRALRRLINAANTARKAGQRRVPAKLRNALISEFRHGVLIGLKDVPRADGPKAKQPPARCLLEDLHALHDDVVRFAFDTRISPTNNLSERDLRPHKTQQKISGRFTSIDATQARLTIRSYISTAAKHGVHILTALRMAILGQPWIPPAAAGLAPTGP